MSIPDFQSLMLPLHEAIGDISREEIVSGMAALIIEVDFLG
jgi:hypothetical protein